MRVFGRKSIIDDIPFDFLRVTELHSKFFYLTSDPNHLLYVSDCSDLSTVIPLSDRIACKVSSQDNFKSNKTKKKWRRRRTQEHRNESSRNLEKVQTNWAAEPEESQIGFLSWDTPEAAWIEPNSWGTPEPNSWGTPVDQGSTLDWNTTIQMKIILYLDNGVKRLKYRRIK